MFASADGNFSLYHKASAGKPDAALTDGKAFFPPDEKYNEYVSKIVFDKPDVSLSPVWMFGQDDLMVSQAKACYTSRVLQAMHLKQEGKDITGIVSVVCSRHGFFFPQGTVDLQKGERYVIASSLVRSYI